MLENGNNASNATLWKRTGTNTLGIVALPQQTMDTADWECETGFG